MAEAVIEVWVATPADAEAVLGLIRAAFGARRSVGPPSEALAETIESVRAQLDAQTGVIAHVDGKPAGCLILDTAHSAEGSQPQAGTVVMRRVAVHPQAQGAGVAWALVGAAEKLAAISGARRVELVAREDYPETIDWWCRGGYQEQRRAPGIVVLGRALPAVARAADPDAMRAFGERLAGVLTAGDVLIASGELGAGKTTLTQGIAAGLDVDGPVISPTFVLSRIHPPRSDGPGLVHVDAYRLGSAAELDDMDLDDTLASSVTLVEWGSGIAEQLSDNWLDIDIDRTDDERLIMLRGHGPRWADVDWAVVVDAGKENQ